MQQTSTIIQGMVMMKFMPTIEKLLTEDMSTCIYMCICYMIYFNSNYIIKYYRKYINKNKNGQTHTLTIYDSRQSRKSVGSKETRAILHDMYINKEKYNILHFCNQSCESTDSNNNWLSLSSIDYINHIYIPTLDVFSFKFKLDESKDILTIYINKSEESSTDTDDKKKNFDEKKTYTIDIYTLNDNIETYINYCNKQYAKYEYDKKNEYPLIENCGGESDDDNTTITRFYSNKTFETIFINETILHEIKSHVRDVLEEAPHFKKMGVSPTFKCILHGQPGTGKTSIIKAILNYCQTFGKVRHIKRVDLSIIKDKDELYNTFINSSAKIIYLEEVDRAKCIHANQEQEPSINQFNIKELQTHSKEELLEKIEAFGKSSVSNVHHNQPNLKIEDILELLDGLPELHGYIILMTTNNIDKIEPRFRRRCYEFHIDYQTDILFKKQLELYYDCDGYFEKNDTILPSNKWTGCDIEKKFLMNPTYPTIQSAINFIHGDN